MRPGRLGTIEKIEDANSLGTQIYTGKGYFSLRRDMHCSYSGILAVFLRSPRIEPYDTAIAHEHILLS